LNKKRQAHGFDDFAEAQCAMFHAETMNRPGLPPPCVIFWVSVSKTLRPTTRPFLGRAG